MKTSDNRSPGDHAWQNELTEEDIPDPDQRDDAAKNTKLDTDIKNEEPVKPAPRKAG